MANEGADGVSVVDAPLGSLHAQSRPTGVDGHWNARATVEAMEVPGPVFSVQCPVSSPNTVTGPRSSLPDFSVRPPAEDPTPTLVPPSTTFRCLLTRRRR